jgi:short-subunit dehydrogenase
MESATLIPFFFNRHSMSYALITGASKGIGREIAFELARRKYDLILVARSSDLLKTLADQLQSEFGVTCHYLSADLTTDIGIEKTVSIVTEKNLSLSILVNNAGYGLWGRFDEVSIEEVNSLLRINVFLPANLTYKLLPELKKSKEAYILNIASTAAYQAVAKLSVYAACKSFMILFSRGLHYELKSTNVSVTCVSPGTTDTNFMDAAGMHSESIRKKADKVKMKPSTVAKIAVDSMFKKKNEVIPGWLNKISVAIIPWVPKFLTEKIAADIYDK